MGFEAAPYGALFVEWQAKLALDIVWEEALHDAVDALTASGAAILNAAEHPQGEPLLVVVAYPASEHGSRDIRTALRRICQRQEDKPAMRLGVAACGRSALGVTLEDVSKTWPDTNSPRLRYPLRPVTPDDLRAGVEGWLRLSLRRSFTPTGISRIDSGYSTESLIARDGKAGGETIWLGGV
jgi:hypothetical protein